MEKMEDGDSIAYEKLIPNSTGTERNHTGKINPTARFRRSGEKMVRRTPSKLISTQSAMKSHIKETGETKENECNQQECPLRGISKKSVIQDEIVLNDECFDSVIESLLQMPVNKSPSKKPVKTIIINLVRVSEKEVIKKAVTWKPCGNEEIPFVVEDKDALNMSSSCDEFEGFSDVSESEISFRKEVLGRLGSHVSVHTNKALKVNDDETNNDQIVEQFLEDGSDNEKFNLSGSDSMEDFEGFDGITDAVKSLKKFQCINRMLVLLKSHDFKSLKDSCLNELSNTEFEASKSVPVKETRTSNLKDFGTNEHESNTENEPSKIEPTVKETTDCSKSTQESSTTHCRSKTMILTEHYFVKDGRFQCKYCEEEKSSAALIQRHLKICSDAPLSVILSSIQYGLNRPVNKNVQPKKKNEKVNSVKAKTTVSLQNQTGDKSENKTKSTLNVIGNKISKPPKKRGRKTKGKDGSVIEEHFVTLLNACDASYSKEPKPPVMSLVKNRLKITDSESLKVDDGSKNHIQLPKENVEENNNHLMTDDSTNILTQKVTVDKRIDQSKREDRLPNANILETSDDVEILEVVNTLNTATCKDIENHDKSTLKQSTQTNNFENNKALFKSRLVENSKALSEKKLVGSYHKLKTDSQKIANNEKLTLEFSVTKENISENDKKLPENEFVKKRKIDQAMVINENAASCKKVTFQSDTVTNNPKNRNSPKIVEYDHVRTVTSDNLGSCEMGSRQPVTQTHCKTDDLANRIGLQPIMSTPSYNLADRKGLGPLLSLEFRNHCPHCSVIINGFNNYGQHLLDHRSQPARIDSTRNELPKQDSVDPTRQLLEKQLPKKDGTDSTHQRISSSNWKKKIMKNYFRSKTIDCGSDCTVSSSGYCSSSSIEPEASCSQSSQTGSSLPAKHFEPNVVSLGSILAMSSQGPPSNSDSYSQPRMPNPNKTVIDSTGYVLTPIDKYISDEIQKYNNCVCGACLEKSNSLRFLINHSYSAHVTCKVNSKP